MRHASVHGSLLDVLMTWLAPDAPRSLASPAAQFITGAILRIDGGQALWGDTWQVVNH